MKKNEILSEGNRFTKARKALLEILVNRHLTFKELQNELIKKGFKNVSTLYNNLEFFLENGLIIEFDIDGVKYYDLGKDNPYHDQNSHLHLATKDEHGKITISELDYPEMYDAIKSHPVFKHYDIESVRILVTGSKKKL
ncbi:transcriptional repressor [Acholeplasma equirhinis]|uniref:Fur family transcriptional regulator n=1 Tax=Acholeplasma equirhinis TaxID=555393 RepID=UPI00197AC496|nr:transcriptional repressor [Acholeplasma equirhinis]MBN3490299.1 transcriptional repressor [Acholeplasma equirhinis]